MSQARVLIVDDEPNIVISLEFLMEREGYEVASPRDGEEALAGPERRPDLVLLDVMMPARSGFEVCQAIRANAPGAAPRSSCSPPRGARPSGQGLALGADAYMTKPFSTKDLLTRVKQLLGT